MALLLRESDVPRTFSSKFAEWVQKPAAPLPRFLKDQIEVSQIPGASGSRIKFAVRHGAPWPYIYAIYVRAESREGTLFEEMIDYDHIGPFSTDDWVVEITGWRPAKVTLSIGIEPFEIQTDTVSVVL